MVNQQHIRDLLESHFDIRRDPNVSKSYQILSDGSVDVFGSARMVLPAGGQIPVQFNHVTRWFQAENMQLTSLKGCPHSCTDLFVARNELTDLQHCPMRLAGLDVSHNKLTSLVGIPDELEYLDATRNPLQTVQGLPPAIQEELAVYVDYQENLPLLRLLVATEIKIFGDDKNLFEPVNGILNKYAGEGKRGAIRCQKALISAGFEANARW